MPDVRGYPDIFSAIMADDADVVEEMLTKNTELATKHDGQSPVLLAAYRHRRDILDILLRQEPRLDIFEAAAVGSLEAVAQTIDGSTHLINAYADDGFTPLHLASFFGHKDVARLLLDRGAKVDAVTRNELENTPLHAAAAGRHLEVCVLLVERSAPVDAQQDGGFTALHTAAQHGDMALAKLLIANGADPAIETDEGKTASDLAYEFEHDDLADYLGQAAKTQP
jgi:ankyrin repeat protein